MNQHLQNIVTIIQQSEHLSVEQKEAIAQSIKNADKELEITSFKLDRTEKVKRTTAILLEETIEELELKRKAVEAQNRELEIESSLERVRTQAMSMSRPDNLMDICRIVYTELQLLGFHELRNAMINIYEEEKPCFLNYDYAPGPGKTVTQMPYDFHPLVSKQVRETKNAADAFNEFSFSGQELKDFRELRKKNGEQDDPKLEDSPSLHYYFYSIGVGSIGISTYSPITENKLGLLKRFRNVFNLAYQRYVDITKAEAQAREAQIEIALERVRSRAMAMHSSDELKALIGTVFTELTKLDLALTRCIIWVFEPSTNAARWWMANGEDPLNPMSFYIKYHEHPAYLKFLTEWKNQNLKFIYDLKGQDKRNWDDILFNETELKNLPDVVKDGMKAPERVLLSASFNNFGGLNVASLEPLSDEHFDLLLRFAKVFDLTYTRFLDLKKAEAQARESQIEVALERVRSRSMAMHKSEELKEVIRMVLEQFIHLNIKAEHAGFYIDYKVHDDMHIWLADPNLEPFYAVIPYFDTPTWNSFLEAKAKGTAVHTDLLDFETKNKFYKSLFKLFTVPEEAKEFYMQCKGLAVSTVLLDNVGLYIENFSAIPYTGEENKILMRFGKVFQQTYTRFLDLQKAEAQAKEAQIETALEKVRSRTLAMQKSDELSETAAVLFQQLIALGIEPNRLYIILTKENTSDMEAWVTDEDGSRVSMGFTGNYRKNISLFKMYEGWKEKRNNLVIDMQGEELQQYFHYLHDELKVPFKGGLEQKRRVQHIAYFSHGLIGMASPDEQPAETLQLLERFASVFNLTFTRFNDLQIAETHALQAEHDLISIKEAKQKAEAALTELQSAQKQLVQSEKMASLGELTAGIAHEIQNPLNFVNNFSEVSKELLDEMKEAIEKGDTEEAKEIMNDVIQNLEKINHHGKRADSIVKGMLQHSRSSSGVKEPTEINVLCDEYLRLSYHGLRAKDKSFNATIKTDFDVMVGNISIVPQDIGRVVLNLLTNAFYVVDEKKKLLTNSDQLIATAYEPTVSVSTKKIGDKVEIKVADNGNGISQKVLDKIFQPFFTTKPTGQGTGLGLSLSYDIVKAHGGELKVKTKEGEGTEFIIQLAVV